MARRADRLFALVQLLRGGKVRTAQWLAEQLEVSERTVYRDIADLQANRVPLEGEAGVGYRLHPGFDLPPLMFTRDEVESLVIGARLVRAIFGETELGSIDRALSKIEAVLPRDRKRDLQGPKLFVAGHVFDKRVQTLVKQLRGAVDQKRVVQLEYTREDGEHSQREVWPLGLFFWGRHWTLVAWCELRQSLRHFRLDRMNALHLRERQFQIEPGKTLEDFFGMYEAG